MRIVQSRSFEQKVKKFTKRQKKKLDEEIQKILDDPAAIRDSLKRQMLAQVNWVAAIENLRASGYNAFLEIGPSKILKDLVLKIAPNVKAESAALFSNLEELTQCF